MGHPSNIPLTPQTDERSFPAWDAKATYGRSGHPYPKMLSREFMPEDVEPWQQANKRHDKLNGDYWENRCPKARKVLANGKVVPGDLVPLLSNQDMVDAGIYRYGWSAGDLPGCQGGRGNSQNPWLAVD